MEPAAETTSTSDDIVWAERGLEVLNRFTYRPVNLTNVSTFYPEPHDRYTKDNDFKVPVFIVGTIAIIIGILSVLIGVVLHEDQNFDFDLEYSLFTELRLH